MWRSDRMIKYAGLSLEIYWKNSGEEPSKAQGEDPPPQQHPQDNFPEQLGKIIINKNVKGLYSTIIPKIKENSCDYEKNHTDQT